MSASSISRSDSIVSSRVRKPLAALALLLAASLPASALAQAAPAPATVSAPVDPERLAIANQIIALAYPPETRRAMITKMGEALTAQVRAAITADLTSQGQLDAGGKAILDRYLDRMLAQFTRWDDTELAPQFAAYARAYARQFSRDELIEIKTFFATPTGARYIQRASDLMADPDVARANTAAMQASFAELKPLQDEMQQELAAYMACHCRRK